MIISKRKFQEALKEAACRAEAETAVRFHQEKSREDGERLQREKFDDLYRQIHETKQEIYRALDDMNRRIHDMERRADRVEGRDTCGRGRHECSL